MKSQYGPPCLPKQIADVVDDHVSKCKNLSLILDKYIPREIIDDTSKKWLWLRDEIQQEKHIDSSFTQAVYKRWLAMLDSLGVNTFTAPLDWRMIVGLGGENVLETDITLHHLYGIPFIPGSALKGLTRAYVAAEHREFFVPSDKPEDQRKPSLKDETDHCTIQRIFGTQKAAGTVLFFDAMPQNGNSSFVVDIMNPHYPDYYKKSNTVKASQSPQAIAGAVENRERHKDNAITSPANDQQPKPITFLAVTDTIFSFALAPRDPKNDEHQADVKQVKEWLLEALHHYGIGGKTSAGYGYFKTIQTPAKATGPSEQASQIAAQLRPNLSQFHEGKELQNCQVTSPTERMQQLFSSASAYLRYQEFPPSAIFIAIEEDVVEARDWKPPESRGCVILRIEPHEDCLVLVCKPRQKKNKKNKEKK